MAKGKSSPTTSGRAKQKAKNFQDALEQWVSANVKGRQHRAQIGGQQFYWNAKHYLPSEAGMVVLKLREHWDNLKTSVDADATKEWQNRGFLRNLQRQFAQTLGVGPFKSPEDTHAQTRSRLPFREPKVVLKAQHQAATLNELAGWYLSHLKKVSPNNAKRFRCAKARLRFALTNHDSLLVRSLDVNRLVEITANINNRRQESGEFYAFNYRRDALRELRLMLIYFQRSADYGKQLEHLRDLGSILKPTNHNTQDSVLEAERRLRWTPDARARIESDVKNLIRSSHGHVRAFVLLAVNCGYLTSEIGHLRNKDYAQRLDWVRPKTLRRSPNPPRMVHHLWTETCQAIEAVRNRDRSPDKPLFVNADGGNVYTNDWVGKQFRRFARSSGIKIQFHQLRKLSANLVENLSNRSGLSSFHLGHQVLTTSGRYYLSPEESETALKDITERIRIHLGIPDLVR